MSFQDTSNANYVLATAPLSITGSSGISFLNSYNYLTAADPTSGASESNLAEADFNGDGIPDLAVSTEESQRLSVLLGKGDGTFTNTFIDTGLDSPGAVVAADFNADGKVDLAVSSTSGKGIEIFLGNGDGTFMPPQLISLVSFGLLASGDLNGDGIMDLVCPTASVSNGVTTWDLTILLGNGDGTFRISPGTYTVSESPFALTLGDFNGDGKLDVAVASSFNTADSGVIAVLLGNGDGTFGPATTVGTGAAFLGLAEGDINGDGKLDLVAVNDSFVPITVLTGNGDGTFNQLAPDPSLVFLAYTLSLADFNGDGILDVAVSDADSGNVYVLLGKGDGTFAIDQSSPTTPAFIGISIATGDFNSDGQTDMAVSFLDSNQPDINDDQVKVWLAQGPGTSISTVSGISPVGTGIHYVDAVYPGDSDYSGSVSNSVPLLAQQVATTITLTAPGSSITGQPVILTATLQPSDAQNHPASGTVTFTQGATKLGTATLSAGIATLSITSLPVGTDYVTCKYSGDTNFLASVCNHLQVVISPPLTTTTTLAITAAGSPVTTVPTGTVVTLTATTLAGTSPVSPGQVNFCDATAPNCLGLNRIGTAQLTTAGIAALKFVPSPGTHSYKAVFLGTSTNTTSSSAAQPLTVTSTSNPATITLADTGVPGNYTLTATVTGAAATTPTGSVSFLDTTNANYLLGSATLSTGTSGLIWIASTVPTNVSPGSLVAADFNNDGYPDVALTTRDSVSILNGNGNGGFPRTTTVTVGQSPRYLAVADFNGDGTPDLAISNQGDGSVSILTSSGNGFDVSAPIPVGLNVEAITTGDFNHDGNADFAVIYNENSIAIFLGKGDGTFTPVAAHLTTDVEPTSIVTGDFNGDGNLDLIVSNAIGSGPTVNGNLTVLLGNGDGTFTPAASPSTGVNPESIAVGDFNNDGKLDLAVANNTSNTVTILLGNGDGTFSASSVATGAAPWSVSIADFNGDGIPDILVVPAVGGTATTTVLFGKGNGTFSATTGPATGNAPLYGVIADFNSDGVPDFAISNAADSTLGIYLTQTSSTATAVVNNISPVGTGPHLVDATYGNSTSNTVSLTAQRVPTTLALTATAAPSGSPINLTAAISPNTAQDHSAGGTVTFYNNGVVLQPGNPVNVSGGVANLAIASLPAGLNNLSAQYSGDTNFAPSSGTGSITISPPPPADFTFIGPPTITFRTESNGVATLSLASLNGFAAPIAITCNTPLPPNYLCTLSSSTITLAANNTASLTLTLHPNISASLTSDPKPSPSKSGVPIALATMLPLTLLALFRRKRRNPLHSLLLLLCLAAATTALTACGSDIYYPATPPGIYPITVTATGTNQGASASTTHTLLLNANITP
jgi:hypothetical protein